ncbi:4-hydroxy-tetrahydrodipicolinate synthase [Pseudorhodoferax sp. Leaf274]|uniref:4-hydroxy-tetrahydrodipicolinate synthase n=1 Tax=Pseudorhodoferax sp. Leaf274 TaxID=1736318 RepID=UPI000702E571|nr:4-hydroxy-tetrahydrodipicolinate synthase [Pseudorhodoferax sp. Leaf274]KQP43064.1 4-hydroxy-tetrahydrodipicolinate synthase [Pseudorhodoferax sp. Leaf274]
MSVSSASPLFSGLWIPLVTPFTADDRVDHAALAALVRDLAGRGVAGFVPCGSTGEAAALTAEEQLAVLDTTLAAAQGLPVLMGVGGYRLQGVLAQLEAVCTRPVAGVLVAAPFYIRPSQEGLLTWFRTLADASPVPLVLYDIPYRTGVELRLETLLALADHPRIQAVKDCGGDAVKTAALIADGRLSVLAGEDAQVFSSMALGASGAITASAHRHTERFVRLIALLHAGTLAEARALWQPLLPWVLAVFDEPNPGPIKALLAEAGLMDERLRAPMTSASPALRQRLRALGDGLLNRP